MAYEVTRSKSNEGAILIDPAGYVVPEVIVGRGRQRRAV